MQRILVGADASDGSEAAGRFAVELATTTGAEVVVIHVNEALESGGLRFPTSFPESPERHDAMARHVFGRVTDTLDDAGIPHEDVEVWGPVARRIVAEADARDVDLIVLGREARHPIAHAFMGSVARRVSHLAHCGVVLVPPPTPQRDAEEQ